MEVLDPILDFRRVALEVDHPRGHGRAMDLVAGAGDHFQVFDTGHLQPADFLGRGGADLTPWGSKTPIRSRREPVVLVDEPAEQVPPVNISGTDGHWVRALG